MQDKVDEHGNLSSKIITTSNEEPTTVFDGKKEVIAGNLELDALPVMLTEDGTRVKLN